MALGKQAQTQEVGDVVDYTSAANDYTTGQVVQVADLRAGVIRTDIDFSVNPLGSATVKGIVKVRKDNSDFAVGDQAFWDNDGTGVDGVTGGAATVTAASGDFPLGRVEEADGTAVDTGVVCLNVLGRGAHIADGSDDGSNSLAATTTQLDALLLYLERINILKTS